MATQTPQTRQRVKGRRPRITEEQKQKAVELYTGDAMTVGEIAASCGFSVPSLYRILREKEVF